MTVPPGAIPDIEKMRFLLNQGTRILWLAEGSPQYPVSKFEILDPKIEKSSWAWTVAKAKDLKIGHIFDTGMTLFYTDGRAEWFWFENFWYAWAYHQHCKQEKK